MSDEADELEFVSWTRLAALEGVTPRTLDQRVQRGQFPQPRQQWPGGPKGLRRKTYAGWISKREAKSYRPPSARGQLRRGNSE